MSRTGVIAASLLLLVPATPALAQAYQCRLPRTLEPSRPVTPDGPARKTAIGGYSLSASWSPEYCRLARNKGTMQCSKRYGRFGFVLHGLWPEAARGPYPQWCATGPRPSPELIRKHLCMTPVPWMLEHEWLKHGTCMTRTPEKYYKVSAILWRSLRWPDADRLSRKEGLTAGDLRKAFVLANPGFRAEQVGIEASGSGWLRGMRVCYDRRFRPTRCPRAHFGLADETPLKIWRGL
ncbi:ribonuclease T [Novosphingobium sp. PC22D]|uniref:ribonuclease T2 family protein n=1 Tax=Novosphingobium sp. PC22D TaxID=1962403 RepID=UPI000BF1C216|nr:ribonuclease T [Novosphingobium sp. PC22D]PEQ12193.1 ribonuclease T [Novosphingobium sp. PC22D]